MTSKIKVDNINKVSDDSNIIKKCGTTTTIGSGASNPIVVDGSAVTLGRCGGTVALASGATQTGFGRTGTVDWQTSIKTSTITAVNGEGYFVNTTGGAITANLPAGSAGAIVAFRDYANTFDSNKLTISANGSEKINGDAKDLEVNTEGESLTLVYADATKGWLVVNDGNNDAGAQAAFVTATGGTVTTCGNFKVHTFTSSGTFCVSDAGNAAGSNLVDYLVIAGGGGAGSFLGGAGGAGGYRESSGAASGCYSASPLGSGVSALTVTATGFPITVGGGGAAASTGAQGGSSIFSTITSAGGGYGNGSSGGAAPGGDGGSGGGGGGTGSGPGGTGNTPPVSPPQGNNGGNPSGNMGGGGGGASAAASTLNGGNGTTSSINFSAVARGGGGAGGTPPGAHGTAGTGGGGSFNVAGTANTGGGGGGDSGAGGSGIVIIRYKFQ